MSPSRFSAGMTSGSPVDATRSAKVASISCGSYGHVGMAGRGRVHLLLEHPFVDRRDRELRAAEHLRAGPLGLAERELGDGAADAPFDALRAERDLVVAPSPSRHSFAPYASPTAMRTTEMGACTPPKRNDAGDAAAGADDHLAADLLAQDPVRRADVVRASRA